MHRTHLFLTAALVGTTIALVQPVAAAKSTAEVEAIAKAVTIEINIKLPQENRNGSGVIIHKQGNLYTLVTNRHVICGTSDCRSISTDSVFTLELPDGNKYEVPKGAIKLLGSSDNIVDLAIIQFRSNRSYAVAKVAAPGNLKVEDKVYTAGYPFTQSGLSFNEGNAIAVVNKRLTGDNGGYTIVYNALTLPGMSGGGVFNSGGQLVAIHGMGDRVKENTYLTSDDYQIGTKIGLNRGIPVRWLVQNLAESGINLGIARNLSNIRVARAQVPITADEYFIAGFNKFVEPGDSIIAGKQQAIQEFSTAIQLSPRYQYAYFVRALVYEQIQKIQQSLADYNQVIALKPNYIEAYFHRSLLKENKLSDIPGALADLNQAILINPNYTDAYNNRALLKRTKLNDIKGALADYNQAIDNSRDFNAYNNRANLKHVNLNDFPGALADYNQAILINPKFFKAYYNRADLKGNKLNDLQGALADYNQAILLNPKSDAAYYNRANLKGDKLNDFQGALADYNQAILINSRFSGAYNNRAILKYQKLNDPQGSLSDYNQAILINPKYSSAYNNRGNLKRDKLDDPQGALVDYNQAILINSKFPEAYYNRAFLKHSKLNDPQGALSDYNQAILINPKYSSAYNNRAILKYQKLNDQTGAIQDFRQAARLFREQGKTESLQKVLKILQLLGVSE
jgi:tetratricopeptide (TPR) repeat protein/V8-like Glu-specific endopeptidase